MPRVTRSALVHFSAEQMFTLVNDVPAYPGFIQGCAEARVLEQSDSHMKASLLIAKAGVKQWFTTANTLEPGRAIHMHLEEGPFTHLSGHWRFTPLAEDACKVELDLEFEFASKLAQLAFGKVFNTIANNMVMAFSERAKEVYA